MNKRNTLITFFNLLLVAGICFVQNLAHAGASASAAAAASAVNQLNGLEKNIRRGHPRLFLNADTLPAVRQRAEGVEKAHLDKIKSQVEKLEKNFPANGGDMGVDAAKAAFLYLITGEKHYADLAWRCMNTSLDFYESRYAERKSVSWYTFSRQHAVIAWDWLYDVLPPSERDAWMSRMLRYTQALLEAEPPIRGEHISSYRSGFYGIRNLFWYIGVAAFDSGVEPALAKNFLREGFEENIKMLDYRSALAGDDGDPSASTLTYAFGAYPWAEFNFFYTLQSATGKDIAAEWPYLAMQTNYLFWNWIPSDKGPLLYGNGDVDHLTNGLLDLKEMVLYSHLANIRHFYGKSAPEYAALAELLQDNLPQAHKTQPDDWFFFYPFLQTAIEPSAEKTELNKLPMARHFENAGQVFMRSGWGKDDTFAYFTAGGNISSHRQYDNLSFIIHHKGFLALDSGTRWRNALPANRDHLLNYFAQSVAHNTILIHQPGEPAVPFWGLEAKVNHGGQHKALGSELKAFEVNDYFVYAAADATDSYRQGPDPVSRPLGTHDTNPPVAANPALPDKAELVTRQMVFIAPSHFVIFDRVRSSDAAYRKEWLLHTANQPQIDGNTVRSDHRGGRLFSRTLLPSDANIRAVGGAGNEFTAGGKNWPLEGPLKYLGKDARELMGQWRVEVSPAQANREDLFLHVIQVGDQGLEAMDEVQLLEGDNSCGVRLKTGGDIWTVTFNTEGDLGGHIRMENREMILVNQDLAQSVQPQSGIKAGHRHMTLEQARQRIPERELPAFWVADNPGVEQAVERITRGKVSLLTRSSSGHPIHLVEYGELEPRESPVNYGSAIGAYDSKLFMDRDSREKPVVYFVGPVHGHETEGLIGLVNFLNVLETGKDLRGKDQSKLRALADQCRLLIIPNGNPDGLQRFEPGALEGMTRNDVAFWGQGTWEDHTLCGWPGAKGEHPRKVKEGFLGCYFDDDGVNAMHDEFFAPMSKVVPVIMDVARREGPDMIVSLHSFSNNPLMLQPRWVPTEVQQEVREINARFNALCAERGLPHAEALFEVTGRNSAEAHSFNLVSALFHISGATSFVFEAPHGVSDGAPASLEENLDIQLALYEAMLQRALDNKREQTLSAQLAD